jgi:hypothetical protein
MLFALGKPPLLPYTFRHRVPRTGKWIGARYGAKHDFIVDRYAEWEIAGPAETRSRAGAAMFSPSSNLVPRADHLPIEEPLEEPPPEKPPDDVPPVEEPPPIEDQLERFLALVPLRSPIE